ncbi:MAG: BNR-4 repeat-containing protein [Deltaproteobacteria bacterium]|nr:BNR-4 repeat-containing protein [Deltaproteobacteria bacterium]
MLLAGCDGEPPQLLTPDAAEPPVTDDGGLDSGEHIGHLDAGTTDTGSEGLDVGPVDTGAGRVDGGEDDGKVDADTPGPDAGDPDSGVRQDAGAADAHVGADAGSADAARADAGAADASMAAPILEDLLYLEAELATSLFAPMQVAQDGLASNLEFIEVPVGAGTGGAASFSIEVVNSGTFRVWGRFVGPSGTQNSFRLAVDQAAPLDWHVPQGTAWTWGVLKNAANQPAELILATGRHTLQLLQREAGTRVDKLLLARNATYVPIGSGGPAGNVFRLDLEAESAALIAPFMVAGDAHASAGQFVSVPEGSGANSSVTSGVASFAFSVPRAARYYLWGREIAPDLNSDSFWVQVDSSPVQPWSLARSRGWRWDRVNASSPPTEPLAFELVPGAHELKVIWREDGAQLDRLVITDGRGQIATLEVEVSQLASVWSGTRVGFDLLTEGDLQAIAYYSPDRYMTVAARRLPDGPFQVKTLTSQYGGWDSHNNITMAVDGNSDLHVAGNFHNEIPLAGQYFRTATAGDVMTLAPAAMVGTEESSITYPLFFQDPLHPGGLLFLYRFGVTGNGDHFLNRYDAATRQWTRELQLFKGYAPRNEDGVCAYPVFKRDATGWYHMAWIWSLGGGFEFRYRLSYARSQDLRVWQDSAGRILQLPLTDATAEPVIDNVPTGGGLLNTRVMVGFDLAGQVVVSYHRYVDNGNGTPKTSQILNARPTVTGWQIVQASDWTCQWVFTDPASGVGLGPVTVVKDRSGADVLTQTYRSCDGSHGNWVLDPVTLRPVGEIVLPAALPTEISELEPAVTSLCGFTDDVGTATLTGRGSASGASSYLLRWISLEANRDLPRENPVGTLCEPAPTSLHLYQAK